MNSREQQPHEARSMAESFGVDPARYDRTRPSYPEAMVHAIRAASPGRDVLDVGCGTGISSRLLEDAGCRVLGVEIDPRMAAFAQGRGLDVELAKFEDWESAGRTFDAVVSGTTWHWIDPLAGANKAASILRPSGLLAVFWNVQEPPVPLAEAFSAVYERILPGSPFARSASAASYTAILDTAIAGIRATGSFNEPETRQFDWHKRYTRAEWLDLVPTAGGHSLFPADTLDAVLTGHGDAIDAAGGSFTMHYATRLLSATRSPRTQSSAAETNDASTKSFSW